MIASNLDLFDKRELSEDNLISVLSTALVSQSISNRELLYFLSSPIS